MTNELTDVKFETIDISDMSSEEIGTQIELCMAKEQLVVLDNKKCGYHTFLVPSKYITEENLTQMIQVQPMMEPLEEFAVNLKSELDALKKMFNF